MTRTVDQAYWQAYFGTHNAQAFEELVARFYAPDAVFSNPRAQVQGRAQILDFFKGANQDVQITLEPTSIVINPGVTAVEITAAMRARRDLPGFFIVPLKEGAEISVPMAGIYHMTAGYIFRARMYWGRFPKLAPAP